MGLKRWLQDSLTDATMQKVEKDQRDQSREALQRRKGRCKVIGLFSRAGGAGKSTISSLLGIVLAKLGYVVFVLDANSDGGVGNALHPYPNPSTSFELLQAMKRGEINSLADLGEYCTNEGTFYLLQGDNSGKHGLTSQDYKDLLELGKRYFNVVIVDCGTSYLNEPTPDVLRSADALVIPMLSTVTSAYMSAIAADNIRDLVTYAEPEPQTEEEESSPEDAAEAELKILDPKTGEKLLRRTTLVVTHQANNGGPAVNYLNDFVKRGTFEPEYVIENYANIEYDVKLSQTLGNVVITWDRISQRTRNTVIVTLHKILDAAERSDEDFKPLPERLELEARTAADESRDVFDPSPAAIEPPEQEDNETRTGGGVDLSVPPPTRAENAIHGYLESGVDGSLSDSTPTEPDDSMYGQAVVDKEVVDKEVERLLGLADDEQYLPSNP